MPRRDATAPRRTQHERLADAMLRDARRGALAASKFLAEGPVARLKSGKPLSRADRQAIAELLDAYERMRALLPKAVRPFRTAGRPRGTGRLGLGIGDLIEWIMRAEGVTRPAAIRMVEPRATAGSDEYEALRKAHDAFRRRGGEPNMQRAVAALDAYRAKFGKN